ncbi:MAG TPA: OmpA family protein [Rhizomicrobium sp.]|jgi:outer membrane protein OmpA-like peptidoglycan-associated protein
MKRAVAIVFGCAALALAAPAWAQEEMYPGQSVTVNPAAIPYGPYYARPPAYLRVPTKHRAVHHARKPKPEQTATVDVPGYNVPRADNQAAAAPPPAAAPAPPPKPVKTAVKKKAAAPVQAASTDTGSNGNGMPFSFDAGSNFTPAPAAPPSKPAKKELASIAPAPKQTPSPGGGTGGLTRRSQIIFAAGAADPAPNALDAIRMLGGDLNSALNGGASRIQIQAYGGARSDKSSDARRLSLKRALAIRQILIDAGVPGAKIDVRAMGGANEGPPDRVDVFVKA